MTAAKPHTIYCVFCTKSADPGAEFHIWSDHASDAEAHAACADGRSRGFRMKVKRHRLNSQEFADWNRGEEYMIPVVA